MTGYDKNHTELMITECQVADCARQEFTDQKRSEMTVKEFVEYWQAHHQLSNKAHKEEDFDSSSWKMTQDLLYLKDWHFVKVWVQMEHWNLFCLMSVNELQSTPCSSPLSFRICKWENSSALSSRKNNCGFVGIFMCTLQLHFWFQEYPDYVAYETPMFFEDDWLNLYLDETCTKTRQEDGNGQSDYRFVYMGPKGRSVPRFCCSFVN